eukprot:scaffold95139_cov65-Phaeocystis_antarctica.AAC.6
MCCCGVVAYSFAVVRLGCVCGRRLGTGSGVSVRQTTNLVVRGLGIAWPVCPLSYHPERRARAPTR